MQYIANHGYVKKLFEGSNFNCGYYAWIEENDELTIGEERGREGGILYCGEYKGFNTPYMIKIKKENIRLYNSIVSHFDKEGTMAEKYAREYFEQFMKNRGFKNTNELTDYVMYLEDIKHDHETLKDKIANLNKLAQEMY